MSLHLGCRLMRQSSYSPRCKKLVALGSLPPFAAVRLNGRSRNSEFIVRSATNDWTCPPSRACVDPRADTADARLPGSPGFGQWHDHFDRALIKGARYGARKER